jgi:hypothetical protein
MLVKHTSGMRKDQVQDLAPAVARIMLKDGRAVLAFPDQFPAAEEDLKQQPPAKKPEKKPRN